MTRKTCVALCLAVILVGAVSCGRKAPLLPVLDDAVELPAVEYSRAIR